MELVFQLFICVGASIPQSIQRFVCVCGVAAQYIFSPWDVD